MEGDILRALSSGWRQDDPELLQRALQRGLCSDEGAPAATPRRSTGRARTAGTRNRARRRGTAASAVEPAAPAQRGAAGQHGGKDEQGVADDEQQGREHGALT